MPQQAERGLDRVRAPDEALHLLSAGVGLARLTVGASRRIGGWALGASLRLGNRVLRAAIQGETAASLLENAADELREQARDLLGIVDASGRIVGYRNAAAADQRALEARVTSTEQLRAKGAALLETSADVGYEEPFHPAYARILDDLAPDEARILRLLAREGSQPIVDVYSASAFGGSELIAAELSMVGAEAGCRFMDRVPSYLHNLRRLGLVWVSPREVSHDRYQVLEAQPDVTAAMRRVGRAKTVRRSLELTPFGFEFARTCLPLDLPWGP